MNFGSHFTTVSVNTPLPMSLIVVALSCVMAHSYSRTAEQPAKMLLLTSHTTLPFITCVFDERAACRDLPQLHHRVFATGQDVLGVLGEDCRADLGAIVGLLKGGDATVGNAIPQLDAAVLAAGDVAVGSGVVADATDGVCVLVQGVARHEALEGINIVEAEGRVLCSHQQEVTRRVEGNRTEHFGFLQAHRCRQD